MPKVSITIECPHCGSKRCYVGDPMTETQWSERMAGKVCSHCGKPLGKRKAG